MIIFNEKAKTAEECFGIPIGRAEELIGTLADLDAGPVGCLLNINKTCKTEQEVAYCLMQHGIVVGMMFGEKFLARAKGDMSHEKDTR